MSPAGPFRLAAAGMGLCLGVLSGMEVKFGDHTAFVFNGN